MANETSPRIEVSRRLEVPAHAVFEVLCDPAQHLAIDGSEMLRGPEAEGVLTAVGDVFLMRMYFERFGDYVMRNEVTAFEQDRRIEWEPVRHDVDDDDDDESWHHRWGFELTPDGPGATTVCEYYDCSGAPEHARALMEEGTVWREAMLATLERLDRHCAGGGA